MSRGAQTYKEFQCFHRDIAVEHGEGRPGAELALSDCINFNSRIFR